ncbi:Fic family protein [Patescibacteria group bacterium]|nr:Fic family protein [Patescibacteria group bacterium]
MKKDDPKSPSRYSVGGAENKYMDDNQTVLKNKRDISDVQTLQLEEERALARAYELLFEEVRSDTPMTTELVLHVHEVVFGELYEWAGRWRTVTISKPGVTWPPPDYLDEVMEEFEQNILKKYPALSLQSDEDFCKALAHIQGEFLAIHPFREGNARTIKLVTDLLAVQTGRLPLSYDDSDTGKKCYIEAAAAAIIKDFQPMHTLIIEALNAAQLS